SPKEDLLNTLEDLRDDEFKDFHWHLQQHDILEGYQPVRVCKLEKAERRDTVDLMLNTFKRHGALKVTKKVLEKLNRNDLVQILTDASSGPEGQSHFIHCFFFSKKSVQQHTCTVTGILKLIVFIKDTVIGSLSSYKSHSHQSAIQYSITLTSVNFLNPIKEH
uniref:Pyrin domain-containing protein n=1 Tax=Cyclopterus lumpus TaxID=8103 RepID=A0A8C2Z538_CYCLU